MLSVSFSAALPAKQHANRAAAKYNIIADWQAKNNRNLFQQNLCGKVLHPDCGNVESLRFFPFSMAKTLRKVFTVPFICLHNFFFLHLHKTLNSLYPAFLHCFHRVFNILHIVFHMVYVNLWNYKPYKTPVSRAILANSFSKRIIMTKSP